MKRALTVLLFLSFTIGVFVDGYEVSVTEGDSVTLKSGVSEIQTDDEIVWRFNGTLIATISRDDSGISVKVEPDGSFRDRLQLDNQTGDLKIINIRTTDSGEYKVKISSPSGSSEIIFTVKVVPVDVFADEVESVSGLEGYSVTLHTHLTEIQGDDVIQWRYGPQKSPVAEINRKAGTVNTVDTDGRFRDRLKLDRKTGSLIIIDTRTTDSGLYEVEISRSRRSYTRHYTQSFRVTVRGPRQSPAAVAMNVFGVVGFLLAAAGVIYYCCKKCKTRNQSGTTNRGREQTNRALNGTQDTRDNEETELTNAS
ncbi:uncharacterized protein LOC127988161 isoform X4 [Carassius gibelio]|uniref:uncharacterized protein LOC127988161 isoform X4 n=1 Tax=Carassius gibelio TaxID=101364 RepID=UPI0022788720|nr:uncharacterized protein LOC127988161 isoform X4 [Carassius gibelio]